MTDPIATIRCFLHGGLLSKPSTAKTIEALDALEAELTALRETALDLSRVPEGAEWTVGSRPANGDFWAGCQSADHTGSHVTVGPTPRAALDAAIARTNEHGETK